MKDFYEHAVERIVEGFGNTVKNMATSFAGGAIQRARGQSLNLGQAVTDPLQMKQNQYQQSQGPNPYQKFLDGKQSKIQTLNQWFQKPPINYQTIGQHYGNNLNQFQTDMGSAMERWLEDDDQPETGWQQYLQQQLKLPQGSFNQ